MNIKDINFKKYTDKASALLSDNQKVQELLASVREKIQSVIESNDKLKEFVEQINVMIRMIKAQYTGQYKEFPWKSIVMITGALIYFITPLDFIPDFIPALGLTDDAAVVYWVYRNILDDVEKFREWEIAKGAASNS